MEKTKNFFISIISGAISGIISGLVVNAIIQSDTNSNNSVLTWLNTKRISNISLLIFSFVGIIVFLILTIISKKKNTNNSKYTKKQKKFLKICPRTVPISEDKNLYCEFDIYFSDIDNHPKPMNTKIYCKRYSNYPMELKSYSAFPSDKCHQCQECSNIWQQNFNLNLSSWIYSQWTNFSNIWDNKIDWRKLVNLIVFGALIILSIFNIRSCVHLHTLKKTVDEQDTKIHGYEKMLNELVPSHPLSPLPLKESHSNEPTLKSGN